MLHRCRALVVIAVVVVAAGFSRAAAANPVAVFDEAHGERFLAVQTGPLGLSALAALFTAAGWEVRPGRGAFDDATLADVDAVVISGAFATPTSDEIDSLMRFMQRGGRLGVMLHIGPPVDPLLYRLNVAISNGVIREHEHLLADDPLNFMVTDLDTHPLLHDVGAFAVYGAWALRALGSPATVIARTSPTAWIDLNGNAVQDERDPVQAFGVLVAGESGKGRFVFVGDDAVFQNQFLTGGNATLARNLVAWFAPGAPWPTKARRRTGGV